MANQTFYCGQCGSPLVGDSRFCTVCGAEIPSYMQEIIFGSENPDAEDAGSTGSAPGQEQDAEKAERGAEVSVEECEAQSKRKRNLTIGIVVAAAAVVVILLLAVFATSTKVDLDSYLTVNPYGYDGKGTLTYGFNEEEFREEYEEKIAWKRGADLTEYNLTVEETSPIDFLLAYCLHITLDLSENDLTLGSLENGDVIEIKWDCDEELAGEMLRVNLNYTDTDYEIEGLVDPNSVPDPFDGIEIIPSEGSIAPRGELSLAISGSSDMAESDFELSPNTNLVNGDTVKVSLTRDAVAAYQDRNGIEPYNTEKEYTVEGFDSYLMQIADIPEESLEKLRSSAEETIKNGVIKTAVSGVALTDTEYQGAYLVCGDTEEGGYTNTLYLVYKVNATAKIPDADVDESFSFYTYVNFRELILRADGIFDVDLDESTLTPKAFSREFGKKKAEKSEGEEEEAEEEETAYAKGEYFGYTSMDKLLEALESTVSENAQTDSTLPEE